MSAMLTARKALRKCYKRESILRQQMSRLAQVAFPLGVVVSYRHGDTIRVASVIEHHGLFDRLKVRGATGAEYWIEAEKLLEEQRP